MVGHLAVSHGFSRVVGFKSQYSGVLVLGFFWFHDAVFDGGIDGLFRFQGVIYEGGIFRFRDVIWFHDAVSDGGVNGVFRFQGAMHDGSVVRFHDVICDGGVLDDGGVDHDSLNCARVVPVVSCD
jgi:hypothetical protein